MVLAGLGGPHPESVTVNAAHGFPGEELANVSKEAGMVPGVGGAGGVQPDAAGLDGRLGHSARAARLSSSGRRTAAGRRPTVTSRGGRRGVAWLV